MRCWPRSFCGCGHRASPMLEPPGNEAMLDSALQQRRSRLLPILAVSAGLSGTGRRRAVSARYVFRQRPHPVAALCLRGADSRSPLGIYGHPHLRPERVFRSRRLLGRAVFHPFGIRPGHRPDRACDRHIGRRRHGADRWMAGFLARGKRALRFGHYAGVADRLHAAALLRRSVYRFEQRTVRLRELRSFRGSLVLDRRHAAGGSGDGVMGIREQRRRPCSGGDSRERAALPISRPGHAAAEDHPVRSVRRRRRHHGLRVRVLFDGGRAGVGRLRVWHRTGHLHRAGRTRHSDRPGARHHHRGLRERPA